MLFRPPSAKTEKLSYTEKQILLAKLRKEQGKLLAGSNHAFNENSDLLLLSGR